MTNIHILSLGFTNPNSSAFLYPLIVHRRALKQTGFNIKIFTEITPALTDCDLLLIEHKAITHNFHEGGFETLQKLAEEAKIIWCDQSDSAGTFLGQVLPYITKYLKAQILADLTGYKKTYHGDRIYTDYYYQKHGITDDIFYEYTPVTDDKDLSKIGLSWNSGLMHHGWAGPYINQLYNRIPCPILLHYPGRIARIDNNRTLDVSCRMGISYPRATVRYQREQIREILKDYIPTDKLSRSGYFKELAHAKVTLSPFGYGEITLKDFEVFLTGSALMKPDMSHMKTWPDFYQPGVTYVAHDWDLSDVDKHIEALLEDEPRRHDIAQHGQAQFLRHTRGKEARALFIRQFSHAVKI